MSPIELFSHSKVRPNLEHFHPFGCPVYVLDERLQGGNKLPRWEPRARVGIHLGRSPHHAASVGLILNTETGHVSPQYHCVYDDLFETPKLEVTNVSKWQELALFDIKNDSYNPTPNFFPQFAPSSTQMGKDEGATTRQTRSTKTKTRRSRKVSKASKTQFPPDAEPDPPKPLFEINLPPDDTPPLPQNEGAEEQPPTPAPPPAPNEGASSSTPQKPKEIQPDPPPPDPDPDPDPTSSSNSSSDSDTDTIDSQDDDEEETPKAKYDIDSSLSQDNIITGTRTRTAPTNIIPSLKGQSYLCCVLTEVVDYAFPATEADPDTMTLKQALQEPDSNEFLKAMEKEVEDHVSRNHWKLVTNQQMRDSGYKGRPIMAVWSMKRKRNPLGQIVKYKARLCAHGGQTVQGIHYTNTFAPVVTWTTIRFLLILSLVHNWHTRQLDFILAYPQAKVSHDLYMHVPEKFTVSNDKLTLDQDAPPPFKQRHKLKLLQNLYGLKDAGATWFNHLKQGLLRRDFKQSEVDPCLFYKTDLVLIVYVDDCIMMTPKPNLVDEFIKDMQREYKLEDEGDINAYLGINVTRPTSKTIKLNQPALIRRIVQSMELSDRRQHDTPADTVLNKDSEGPDRQLSFNYRSVIGQLNYLTSSTRPDIQFATHQCARFCNAPKLSHEIATKRIIRYLKSTLDDGIILTPDLSKGFECFVDADFAGAYKSTQSHDPSSCLSRTGYVILYASCPIIWSSKMQTTIALSTTEAEYVALSSALRDVIFLLQLVHEFKQYGITIPNNGIPSINCKVFEDNVGAMELANNPKLRPRTKHIAVQYHHFRSYVERKQITVQHVDTKEQLADIFTKPLPRPAFLYLRHKLLGW